MSQDHAEVSWSLDRPPHEPVRLGGIGAGVMAAYAVYPALHFAAVTLKAICDLDADRAREAAARFGCARWYTDYQKMLQKEDLEAVIIHMHPVPRRQIVVDTLQAGKHVFMPKPPAMSYQETMEQSEVARAQGKILMVNFQSRFSYAVRQALKIMKRPEFGQLTQYLGSFCSGTYDEERTRFYRDPVQAFLLDFTPHHLDLARYLAGEVTTMALYHGWRNRGGACSMALEFQNGAVGTLQFNSHRIWWRNYDRIELTGEGQYLVLDGLWKIKHYTRARNTFSENYRDERSGELTGDAYALREFVDAIRNGREPSSSIHDSVKTMKLYQALYDAVTRKLRGVIFEES